MDEQLLKNIIEALLLSVNEPLSVDKIQAVFEDWQQPSVKEIKHSLGQLEQDYSSRAFVLVERANGYQLQTRVEYSSWIARLQIEKPTKYSRALLETLAIIAYKQPVTRADIEELRGVSVSSQIMKTLMEREWIRIAGHKDVPGKPAVYTTSKDFLNYFNLKNLNELPTLADLSSDPLYQASQINQEIKTP